MRKTRKDFRIGFSQAAREESVGLDIGEIICWTRAHAGSLVVIGLDNLSTRRW